MQKKKEIMKKRNRQKRIKKKGNFIDLNEKETGNNERRDS